MERKARKMKWFDRWFYRQAKKAWEARDIVEQDHSSKSISPTPVEDVELHNTIRFNITPARGGSVVTVARYDQRKDNNEKTVYVINESDDIGRRVSEIVTMEMYRS